MYAQLPIRQCDTKKKSLGTISLCRQGDTTNYIPKFQVAKMSLEVAEIRFSNLVLQALK